MIKMMHMHPSADETNIICRDKSAQRLMPLIRKICYEEKIADWGGISKGENIFDYKNV